MKNKLFAFKVILVLFVFSPLALIPVTGRTALIPSRTDLPSANRTGNSSLAALNLRQSGLSAGRAEAILTFLSPAEIMALAAGSTRLYRGGQSSSPLSTNEVVAIVITLLIVATAIGFVEQGRH